MSYEEYRSLSKATSSLTTSSNKVSRHAVAHIQDQQDVAILNMPQLLGNDLEDFIL